jgi:hypothetical protein
MRMRISGLTSGTSSNIEHCSLVFSNVYVFHVWIMFLCGFTLILIDILGENLVVTVICL